MAIEETLLFDGIDVNESSTIIDKKNAVNMINLLIDNPFGALNNDVGTKKQYSIKLEQYPVSIVQLNEEFDVLFLDSDGEQYWEIFSPIANDDCIAQCYSHYIYKNEIYMSVTQINLETFDFDYEIQVLGFDKSLKRRWDILSEDFGNRAIIWVYNDKVYCGSETNSTIQKFDIDGTFDLQWNVPWGISYINVYDNKVYAKTFVSPPAINFYIYDLVGNLLDSFVAADFFGFTIDTDTEIIYGGRDYGFINKYSLTGVSLGTFVSDVEIYGLAIFNNILYTTNSDSITIYNKNTEEKIITYGEVVGYYGQKDINRFYANQTIQVYNRNGINRLYISDVSNGVIGTIL
jgi:hypothetical protein